MYTRQVPSPVRCSRSTSQVSLPAEDTDETVSYTMRSRFCLAHAIKPSSTEDSQNHDTTKTRHLLHQSNTKKKKTPRLVCPRKKLHCQKPKLVQSKWRFLPCRISRPTTIHQRTYYQHHRLSPPQHNVFTSTSANFWHFHHRLKPVRPEINAPSMFI